MSLKDVPTGVTVFLDANVMVFHFSQQHPLSADCTALLERSAKGELRAITSAVGAFAAGIGFRVDNGYLGLVPLRLSLSLAIHTTSDLEWNGW